MLAPCRLADRPRARHLRVEPRRRLAPPVARCDMERAGWDNDRRCGRAARCSPCLPDLRTSRSRSERGNYPVVTPLLIMDHRIVAWAPGGDGLVGGGRAPAS